MTEGYRNYILANNYTTGHANEANVLGPQNDYCNKTPLPRFLLHLSLITNNLATGNTIVFILIYNVSVHICCLPFVE